jgi:cytochrome d ubiquinol oxidase subunit II
VNGDALALLWFGLLGVLLAGYAVLDGFDLGVGIVHPFVPRGERERRLAVESIGPLWDGNEVWLVTFGGALFAAFPEAYATVLSAFYLPFMALLFFLMLRAVSLEFRSKRRARAWQIFWDGAFALGSLGATVVFGTAVGALLVGIPLDARGEFVGTMRDLVHPYALGVAAMTVALFALHGAAYLVLRTEGELQRRARRVAWHAFGGFLALFLVVTMVTLVEVPRATAPLRAHPWLWAVPAANVLAIANIPRALFYGQPVQAFASTCVVIGALVALLGTALFPTLVPSNPLPEHGLTLWNAASSAKTLGIMALVAALGMPLVLAYTALVYWAFWGKVRLDEGGY